MDPAETISVGVFCRTHSFPRNLLYDHLRRFVDERRTDGRSSREEFPDEGFYVRIDRQAGRRQYHITDEEAFKTFALRLTDYAAVTSEELELIVEAAALVKKCIFEEGDWRLVHRETNKRFPANLSYWSEVARVLQKVL